MAKSPVVSTSHLLHNGSCSLGSDASWTGYSCYKQASINVFMTRVSASTVDQHSLPAHAVLQTSHTQSPVLTTLNQMSDPFPQTRALPNHETLRSFCSFLPTAIRSYVRIPPTPCPSSYKKDFLKIVVMEWDSYVFEQKNDANSMCEAEFCTRNRAYVQ